MYDIDNPILLDTNTVFFDNKNIFYVHREIDSTSVSNKSRHLWMYDLEKNQIKRKINVFDLNIMNINLFIGFESRFCFNNILNSSFYKKDESLKKDKLEPFSDRKDYKGNKVAISLNPFSVVKSLGQENPDEVFQKVLEAPFDDIDSIENVKSFFEMPESLKYPRYFNHYALSRLNSNISVFGTMEEIDGSMLTEKPIHGIKCDLIKNGIDARGRAIDFSDNITLIELENNADGKQKYAIESFSDEVYEDLVTGNDELLKRSFKYTTKIINGQAITVLDTSENASSLVSRLSNKVIFYSEDSISIAPFVDRNIIPNSQNDSNHAANNDYNVGSVFPSHGHDNDNSQGSGPDSFAFTGELD